MTDGQRLYTYGVVDGVAHVTVWWKETAEKKHLSEFAAMGEQEVDEGFAKRIIDLAQQVDESPEYGDDGRLSVYRYRIEPVTVEEAASIIGVSTTRVRKIIEAGGLSATRYGARMLMLDRAEVEKYAHEEHPAGRPRKEQACVTRKGVD